MADGCIIRACGDAIVAREMCGKHYQRWTKGIDPTEVIQCPGCENTFERTGRQKYCSRQCQSRIWMRTRLGIEDPGFMRECWWCRETFRFLDARRLYCSNPCARIAELIVELPSRYGITKDEYRLLYFQQAGVCAICHKPERTERNTLLSVDHDHVTNRVRGLLCSQCNRAIGLLQDDPQVLRAAARYIEENPR